MLSIPEAGHKRQLSFHQLFFVSLGGGGGGGLGKIPEAPFLGKLRRENTEIGRGQSPCYSPAPAFSVFPASWLETG